MKLGCPEASRSMKISSRSSRGSLSKSGGNVDVFWLHNVPVLWHLLLDMLDEAVRSELQRSVSCIEMLFDHLDGCFDCNLKLFFEGFECDDLL